MKRWIWVTGLAALMGLVVWTVTDRKVVKADSGNTVTWEAEKANTLIAPMVAKSGTKYDSRPQKPQKNSGGGWVEIPNKANGGKKGKDGPLTGKAIYKVKVPAAGSYTLWARVMWPNGCGNSFWVAKSGRPPQVIGGDGTYDAWHWVAAKNKLVLEAGTNTIVVYNREDGVYLDEIQITTTKRVPTSAVPASPDALDD